VRGQKILSWFSPKPKIHTTGSNNVSFGYATHDATFIQIRHWLPIPVHKDFYYSLQLFYCASCQMAIEKESFCLASQNQFIFQFVLQSSTNKRFLAILHLSSRLTFLGPEEVCIVIGSQCRNLLPIWCSVNFDYIQFGVAW
jgi:hypothetical protein